MGLLLRRLWVVMLLGVSACSGKPYAIHHDVETSPLRRNTVYVDNHGWHTGFILPADSMNSDLPFLARRFGQVPFYEFGWGDKGFYQSKDITSALTLQAMFWSEGSVIHVVAVPEAPADYFNRSQVVPVTLSDSEFKDLRRFIEQSFAYDRQDNAIALQPGIYGDSQFYAASGDYALFNTCNSWTAKGLKSAGMDLSTSFKLTSGSVIGYLKDRQQAGDRLPDASGSTFIRR